LNARDKMPFEVTAIYYKLQRYEDVAKSPANAAPEATPATTPAPAPTAGQAANPNPAPPSNN